MGSAFKSLICVALFLAIFFSVPLPAANIDFEDLPAYSTPAPDTTYNNRGVHFTVDTGLDLVAWDYTVFLTTPAIEGQQGLYVRDSANSPTTLRISFIDPGTLSPIGATDVAFTLGNLHVNYSVTLLDEHLGVISSENIAENNDANTRLFQYAGPLYHIDVVTSSLDEFVIDDLSYQLIPEPLTSLLLLAGCGFLRYRTRS